jgi:hypothetical protein
MADQSLSKMPLKHKGAVEGLPKIGTYHVYDFSYPRPIGLSIDDAANRGLFLGDGPAAWEKSADYSRGFSNPGNLVWAMGARMLLGNSSQLFMGPDAWPTDGSLSAFFVATGPCIKGNTAMDQLIEHPEIPDLASKGNKAVDQLIEHPEIPGPASVHSPLPFIEVGLGVQVGENAGDRPNGGHDFECMDVLDEGSKRTLDFTEERIKKHGGFVGLRGKCSESVLRRAGYTVFETLGCPSLFINLNPGLGHTLQTKFDFLQLKAPTLNAGANHLKVAVAMPQDYDGIVVPFLAKILAFFPQSILISQNTNDDHLLSLACHHLGLEKPNRKSFIYYDALEWRRKLSQVDLVVSARIHGGMIAIAAETPTVVIPIDMRVLEMVEAMQVPHILPAGLPDDVRDFVVHASSKFDGLAFDKQRRAYATRYKELFNNVGLDANPELSYL